MKIIGNPISSMVWDEQENWKSSHSPLDETLELCIMTLMKEKLNIGITGSRDFTNKEVVKNTLTKLVEENSDKDLVIHHGDCFGADEISHEVAKSLGIEVVVHPPTKSGLRAFCGSENILPPKDFLKRNHCIVDSCDILLGFPKTDKEVRRSGTWATIRYARKCDKEVVITPNS